MPSKACAEWLMVSYLSASPDPVQDPRPAAEKAAEHSKPGKSPTSGPIKQNEPTKQQAQNVKLAGKVEPLPAPGHVETGKGRAAGRAASPEQLQTTKGHRPQGATTRDVKAPAKQSAVGTDKKLLDSKRK